MCESNAQRDAELQVLLLFGFFVRSEQAFQLGEMSRAELESFFAKHGEPDKLAILEAWSVDPAPVITLRKSFTLLQPATSRDH